MSEPTYTNDDLKLFGVEHYTYINQVFGDMTVREIISETFHNKDFRFDVEITGEEFENSMHHILRDKDGNMVCSVVSGDQNIETDVNDTLCQSYSLLTYFGEDISARNAEEKKVRQLKMIKMYRDLLNNKNFIKNLTKEIEIPNDAWIDYVSCWKNEVYNYDDCEMPFVKNMTAKTFFNKIREVLDKWETFGYWYFIGKGKYPKTTSLSIKTRTNYKKQRKTKSKKHRPSSEQL